MIASSGCVLIVDDEFYIRRALHTTLKGLGFEVEEAVNGEEALTKLETRRFDVLLLDVNMPGMGGMAACRKIRLRHPMLPVLMLTVRSSVEDVVQALDAGADDYVTKPFHVGELTARIRSAVRRSHAIHQKEQRLEFGELLLNIPRRRLTKNGKDIHLTPKEFDLLQYLMSNAGIPVSHTRLLRAIWGPEYGAELEYLRTFMRQLRVKIEDDSSRPIYLLTEPHVGYRFADIV